VVLRANGTLIASGYPYDGQTNIPPGLTNVLAVASGSYHNLALVGDGPPLQFSPLLDPTWKSNRFTASLNSENKRVYRLEFKDSLSDSSWSALPLVAGTGRKITLTDPSATGTQRFYRVRQW
jgi:hypothetical protein